MAYRTPLYFPMVNKRLPLLQYHQNCLCGTSCNENEISIGGFNLTVFSDEGKIILPECRTQAAPNHHPPTFSLKSRKRTVVLVRDFQATNEVNLHPA
jgi:hypothetical protein